MSEPKFVKVKTDIGIRTRSGTVTELMGIKLDVPVEMSKDKDKIASSVQQVWPFLLKRHYKPDLIAKVELILPKKG